MYTGIVSSMVQSGYSECVCKLYLYQAKSGASMDDKTIKIEDGRAYVKDSAYTDATAFKSAMGGVMLLYEVATPTEETFDPFPNPQTVNDWGTEEFVVETPLIPVGHDTAYPVNILDKIQNAPDTPSIDGDFIVRYQVDGRVATYVKLSESPVITDCKIRGKLCVLNNVTAIALGTEDFTKFDRASTSGSGVGVTVDNAHCTFTNCHQVNTKCSCTYSSKSSVDNVVLFDLGIFGKNNVIAPENSLFKLEEILMGRLADIKDPRPFITLLI